MRVRTDEKRQAIMEAASAVFGENGYAHSSMAAIARRASTSKQTLYSYFDSKEELFSTVMMEAMESQAQALFDLLNVEAGDLGTTLENFGLAYIDFVTSPEILALIRVAVTEGGQGMLGPRLYALGPMRGWTEVAANLERWARAGELAFEDSLIAALHLKAMLEAGLVEPLLYGAAVVIPRENAARHSVQAFLKAYGR